MSAFQSGSLPAFDGYRLVRALGDGDTVFLAHDLGLDRAVVLRLLSKDTAAASDLLEGARALAAVSHPSICPIHRVCEGAGRPWVVQGFARGERLDELGVALATDQVVAIGRGLGGALASLHSSGVAHGDVTRERVIVSRSRVPRLFGLKKARASAGGDAFARDTQNLLEILVDISRPDARAAFLGLTAALSRSPDLEEVLHTVERLARPSVVVDRAAANPYRGLEPFATEDAPLFFGRQAEVSEAMARLKNEPWLLVAGPSGLGKSSFVHAGLLPPIVGGALGERERWEVAPVAPASTPLEGLARAIALFLKEPVQALEADLRTALGFVDRVASFSAATGLVLVVDPLEDSILHADAAERGAFFTTLAAFAAKVSGVRTILTLRSDFLDRLPSLGTAGRDLLRATFVLSPMRPEGLRHAIIGPARAYGYEMETSAMVDDLVEEVSAGDGGASLPLLSFVLAELWNERDRDRRTVPAAALARLGGAALALAARGDMLLASLAPDERSEARRMLIALVHASQVRGRRTREELLGTAGHSASAALDALVDARLVVSGEVYAIAHAAWVRGWPRLRGWLEEASDAKAAAARIEVAASEWARFGEPADLLWPLKRMEEFDLAGAFSQTSELGRRFASACHAAARRARRRRVLLGLGLTAGLLAAAGAACGRATLELHRAIAHAVGTARERSDEAEKKTVSALQARARAFALFENDESAQAESTWSEALAREDDAEQLRRTAETEVQKALAMAPRDSSARALAADLALAQLEAAQRLHRAELLPQLRAHLNLYDDGSRVDRLNEAAHVQAETDPVGATLTLFAYRPDAAGHLLEVAEGPVRAGKNWELHPGSYLLVASMVGRYTTRYPFVVSHGEVRAFNVRLPDVAAVAQNMIYVPAGRFLYGSDDDEATRGFLTHEPMHEIELPAFLISRTETTFGAYLAFLRDLPESERKGHTPDAISWTPTGQAVLTLRKFTLGEGEAYCRPPLPCTNWRNLPVMTISRPDAEAFSAWLSRTGALPHARLCTNREWERAARGADARRFPTGNVAPGPGEACTLRTFGGDPDRAGLCATGSHTVWQSPFGVEDMTGNVWEWTARGPDSAHPELGVVRSGGWWEQDTFVWLTNRGYMSIGARTSAFGMRVCADLP